MKCPNSWTKTTMVSTTKNCRMVSITPDVEVARFANVSIVLLSLVGPAEGLAGGGSEPVNPLMIRGKNGNFGARPQLNHSRAKGRRGATA
jgi:hypothetical protein